jgi:hypothetical protein
VKETETEVNIGKQGGERERLTKCVCERERETERESIWKRERGSD